MKNSSSLRLLIMVIILTSITMLGFYFYQPLYQAIRLDSLGHIIGFFGLALIFNIVIKLSLTATMLCLSLYAIVSELGQYYLGFRNGEFRDVIADIAGVLLFIMIKYFIDAFKQYRIAREVKR